MGEPVDSIAFMLKPMATPSALCYTRGESRDNTMLFLAPRHNWTLRLEQGVATPLFYNLAFGNMRSQLQAPCIIRSHGRLNGKTRSSNEHSINARELFFGKSFELAYRIDFSIV